MVTNNERLAYRVKLIRNHGEAVLNTNKAEDLSNIIGHNFRLGEIEAAIAREQLKKLNQFITSRQKQQKDLEIKSLMV